jgi:hypothetical protein
MPAWLLLVLFADPSDFAYASFVQLGYASPVSTRQERHFQ